MATLNDILAVLQNGVAAVNNIANSFPPITSVSSVAPANGALAFNSSQPDAYGSVKTSCGVTYTIPLYHPR